MKNLEACLFTRFIYIFDKFVYISQKPDRQNLGWTYKAEQKISNDAY